MYSYFHCIDLRKNCSCSCTWKNMRRKLVAWWIIQTGIMREVTIIIFYYFFPYFISFHSTLENVKEGIKLLFLLPFTFTCTYIYTYLLPLFTPIFMLRILNEIRVWFLILTEWLFWKLELLSYVVWMDYLNEFLTIYLDLL